MSVLMTPKDMIEWGKRVPTKVRLRPKMAAPPSAPIETVKPARPRVSRRVYLAAARKLSEVERVRLWEMVGKAERVLGISETDALELIAETGAALHVALSRLESELRR